LKKSLQKFGQGEMITWLEKKGVKLVVEPDGRMFPSSNSSEEIIQCFTRIQKNPNVNLLTNHSVESIENQEDEYLVAGQNFRFQAKNLVLATGISNEILGLLSGKGINLVPNVPSLFTFKIQPHDMKDLAGISMPSVGIKVLGTKLQNSGAWLVTHQGFSGPSVLKLSAYGARILEEKKYQFDIHLNFSNCQTWDQTNAIISSQSKSQKQVGNAPLFEIPKRLWLFLLEKSQIDSNKRWLDLGKKDFNRLTEELFQGNYHVNGKNTFKEEFVTAGGVDLSEIDTQTCMLRKLENCYAVGELLNVDGVTGGFNFQNCWTSAYLSAKSIEQTHGS
jgi:predicted Rossmann fold flavoprotein